jgi:hypothetical protein
MAGRERRDDTVASTTYLLSLSCTGVGLEARLRQSSINGDFFFGLVHAPLCRCPSSSIR